MEGIIPTSASWNALKKSSGTGNSNIQGVFSGNLSGGWPSLPTYLWDLLLPQAELMLNLLQQAHLNPKISAWEYFNRPFDFNKTPLGPVGCRVLIHAKPVSRRSWDFRAKDGFYIGPAMDSYRCFKLVKSDTKSQWNSGMHTTQFQRLQLRTK